MDLHYKAMIENTYPFDLGFYAEYHFLQRLSLQTGLQLGIENFKLNYADVKTTDSLKYVNPEIAFELLNNPVMLQDETSLFYVTVPLHAKYTLLGNVFIVAGINAKVYLHQRSYHPFELETAVGLGAYYPKWSWKLNIETPTKDNGFRMINNNHDYMAYSNYFVYSRRTLRLTLSYKLK